VTDNILKYIQEFSKNLNILLLKLQKYKELKKIINKIKKKK